ncbi:MAG TPA: hypothetical protein VM324_01100 [Egibacteraceae bacterium]|nr:hypothetical protein [Egibacteraceae bacterium]
MSRAAKIAVAVAVVAVAVVLLFTVVFPWVDRLIADPTMGTLAGLG